MTLYGVIFSYLACNLVKASLKYSVKVSDIFCVYTIINLHGKVNLENYYYSGKNGFVKNNVQNEYFVDCEHEDATGVTGTKVYIGSIFFPKILSTRFFDLVLRWTTCSAGRLEFYESCFFRNVLLVFAIIARRRRRRRQYVCWSICNVILLSITDIRLTFVVVFFANLMQCIYLFISLMVFQTCFSGTINM